MISKNDVFDAIKHEIHVLKHLAEKLDASQMDYRPTEGQRSTIELLRFLTTCSIGPAMFLMNGNFEHGPDLQEKAASVTLENFGEALDNQMAELESYLADFDDDALAARKVMLPWGQESTMAVGLMNFCVKFIAAYKLQLFLYMKSMGMSDLTTPNCWGGMDAFPS